MESPCVHGDFFVSWPTNSGERTKCGAVRTSRLREHATGSIRMEADATPYQQYGRMRLFEHPLDRELCALRFAG